MALSINRILLKDIWIAVNVMLKTNTSAVRKPIISQGKRTKLFLRRIKNLYFYSAVSFNAQVGTIGVLTKCQFALETHKCRKSGRSSKNLVSATLWENKTIENIDILRLCNASPCEIRSNYRFLLCIYCKTVL
jgi:hypothetical protein